MEDAVLTSRLPKLPELRHELVAGLAAALTYGGLEVT